MTLVFQMGGIKLTRIVRNLTSAVSLFRDLRDEYKMRKEDMGPECGLLYEGCRVYGYLTHDGNVIQERS